MSFDLVIVTHPKDFVCLPICVQGILDNVSGSSGKIYIVAPTNPQIQIEGVVFVHEKEFDHIVKLSDIREKYRSELPSTNGMIMYGGKGYDRSGWIYQQFLKLFSGDVINTSERYHIVCSDTFFVNDPHLDENTFHYQKEYNHHSPYDETLDRVFGKGFTDRQYCYNNHHMLFSRFHFNELKSSAENRHGKPLWRACMDCMSYKDGSELSEYIMFTNWMLNNHRQKCVEVKNIHEDLNHLPNPNTLEHYKRIGHTYVNSHEYNRN